VALFFALFGRRGEPKFVVRRIFFCRVFAVCAASFRNGVESITPSSSGFAVEALSDTKKTRKTQCNAGFLGVGGRELESPTSTMSTFEQDDESDVFSRAKRDACERMHLWMHQIAELDERMVPSLLFDSIEESVGPDGVEKVIDAMRRRVESAFPNERRVKIDV